MPFRHGRLVNGTPLQGLIGSAGPFNVPAEQHRKNIADAHGLRADQIELVETEEAPDLSTAQAPIPPEKNRVDELDKKRREVTVLDPAAIRDIRGVPELADALARVVESLQAVYGILPPDVVEPQ